MHSKDTEIITRGGRFVDLLDPQPESIHIEDIAYSLARQIRFVGHSPGWNVALHSLWVSQACSTDYALEGLLHDASEAYLGDVSRPLKWILGTVYTDLEERFQRLIARVYSLQWDCHEIIKPMDNFACSVELGQFWPVEYGSAALDQLEPLDSDLSEQLFLAEFHRLYLMRCSAASNSFEVTGTQP